MAFNDAFLVISVTLLVCAAAIWFCKPSRASTTQRRPRSSEISCAFVVIMVVI
jgi:hypothetical protein